jgi:hypothetical protein
MLFSILGIQKSIGPKEWGLYAHHLSGEPTVGDSASFAATVIAGQRAVSIAPGTALAYGIDIAGVQSATVVLPRPADPGRWYLIALERRHQQGETVDVELVVLTGPATTALGPARAPLVQPAGWTVVPGVKTHQALHWVWVSGTTTNMSIFDVRAKHAPAMPLRLANIRLQYVEIENQTKRVGPGEFVTLAELTEVYTEDQQIIDVNGWARWYSQTNAAAAGKIIITLNDQQITLGPRDHNEGRDFGPRQVYVTGRGVTKPGLNTIKLVATADPTSAARMMSDFALEAVKH